MCLSDLVRLAVMLALLAVVLALMLVRLLPRNHGL